MAEGLMGKLLDEFSVPGLILLGGLAMGVALTFSFSGERIELSKTQGDWSVTIKPASNVLRLGAEEAAALATSISELPPGHPLSAELLRLRDEQKGPFKPVDEDVVVRFDEAPDRPTEWAASCINSKFYGRKITIFKLSLNGVGNLPSNGDQQRDFVVFKEAPLAQCGDGDNNVVWLNAALKPQLLGEEMSSALAEIKGLARVLGLALKSI